MESNLNGSDQGQGRAMVVRCECGVTISSNSEEGLVEQARLHFTGAHPAVGAEIAADLILNMAEEVHQ